MRSITSPPLIAIALLALSACNGGTPASRQAEQAKLAQQQIAQLKQQIEGANAKSNERLQ